MPPEQPPYLVILDTEFGAGGLEGKATYIKPKRGGRLRVRWGVGSPPAGYTEKGGGVVVVADSDEHESPPPDEHAPIQDDDGSYSYVEGLGGAPWLMLVMILPRGYRLHRPAPQPVGSRIFSGRLAFYWLLRADDGLPDSARVQWRVEPGNLREGFQSGQPKVRVAFDADDSEAPQFDVFLSYRNQDDAWAVGRLRDSLIRVFGRSKVFRAPDSIPAGADFRREIDEAIGQCWALIAVIGPTWLDPLKQPGERRIDDELDWVRLEISYALQRHKRVVPLLLDDTHLPEASELPACLQEVAYCQARVLRERSFDEDVRLLYEELQRLRSDIR